jgi:hypothetical protein
LKAQRAPKRPAPSTNSDVPAKQQKKNGSAQKKAAVGKQPAGTPAVPAAAPEKEAGPRKKTAAAAPVANNSNNNSNSDGDDVQFSLVTKPDSDKHAAAGYTAKPTAPGSKMKRLQRMLDTAVKKRQRIDDLKSEGPAGAPKLQQEQWADAMDSAAGSKNTLDTTKLRKAIKKREKKKQVSAMKWKVRKQTTILHCCLRAQQQYR